MISGPSIIGLGSDICDIRRIEATLERYGARFTERIFTEVERRRAERRPGAAASYAKRLAAKAACAKALGTGLRKGVFWRDMELVNLPSGQPTLRLAGGAALRLASLTPPGRGATISLTMTDEYPYAQAVVVISLAPPAAIAPVPALLRQAEVPLA